MNQARTFNHCEDLKEWIQSEPFTQRENPKEQIQQEHLEKTKALRSESNKNHFTQDENLKEWIQREPFTQHEIPKWTLCDGSGLVIQHKIVVWC